MQSFPYCMRFSGGGFYETQIFLYLKLLIKTEESHRKAGGLKYFYEAALF